MGRMLTLESFDEPTSAELEPREYRAESEQSRLTAYEEGYKAGWDDSAASQTQFKDTVTADLAAHVQDLSFTFHEAKAHVLKGLEPALSELLGKIIPEIAMDALPQLIAEQIADMARDAAEQPMIVSVAPSSRQALVEILPEQGGLPIVVREEASLADGQVFLRLGEREREVDISRVATEILDSVQDFFSITDERIAANG